MCLLVVIDNPTPTVRRVILHNRDEDHARPFTPGVLHTLKKKIIFYGTDLKAGGTWLSVSRTLFVAVLNVRLPITDDPMPFRSRGELPLLAQNNPNALNELFSDRDKLGAFRPFNLVQCQPSGPVHSFSSVSGENSVGSTGPFTYSNHSQAPERWFKEHRISELLKQQHVQFSSSIEDLSQRSIQILEDREKTPYPVPTYTGQSPDIERALSPIFVQIPERNYGTVLSTIVLYLESDEVLVIEKNHLTGTLNQVLF